MHDITWELIQVRNHYPAGPRQALFYQVTYGESIYRVMLGINESGHCELLEHLMKDETLPRAYPYRVLPYIWERAKSEEALFRFETIEQAMAFVEAQLQTWETGQQRQ